MTKKDILKRIKVLEETDDWDETSVCYDPKLRRELDRLKAMLAD